MGIGVEVNLVVGGCWGKCDCGGGGSYCVEIGN